MAIVRDLALQSPGFPSRMQGRTGKVIKKSGEAYVIAVKDFTKEKNYIVMPIHLKKIKGKE